MKYSAKDLEHKMIDSHTHAGVSLSYFFDDKYPYCYNCCEISTSIKQAGFDVACVFPFPSFVCGRAFGDNALFQDELIKMFETVPYRSSISRILTEIKRFNLTNLLPFGMFSINYSVSEQIHYLDSIVDDLYGLKYYPDADKRRIIDLKEDGAPFIEFLIKHDLPLVLHVSENACLYACGFSNVLEAIDLAETFPLLRICVAHMGHFSKTAIEKATNKKLDNLFFDVSPLLHICHIRTINKGEVLPLNFGNPSHVLASLFKLMPDKLIWGSDLPFNFTCNLNNDNHNFSWNEFSLQKNVNVLFEQEPELIAAICSRNTVNLLFGNHHEN